MKSIVTKLIGLRLISSIFSLCFSILQVWYFKASANVDAFFIATSAVYLITSLSQGGQLAEVYLPEYLKLKKSNGSKSAQQLLSVIVNRMIFFVGIILLILFFFSPLVIDLIGPGLSPESKILSTKLFQLSLILIIFTLIASFVNTTLDAEQVYGRSELSGLINSFVSILLLVLFHDKLGIWVLVYALLIGKIIEFIIGMTFLKRLGFKYYFIWNTENYNLSKIFKVMLSTSGYVGATQIYSVTMTAMASFLPTGSLSIFNYIQQLSTKGTNIIIGPISTVFFSKFSNSVTESRANLESHLKKPLNGITLISILIFCFILLTGKELLQVLWGKNNLSPSEFSTAYLMLILNFLGFIFSSVGLIFRKSAIALGSAHKLYQSWIFTQLLCAVYAFVSIRWAGIYGLASILVLNMFSMALVSIVVSEKSGLKGIELFKTLFLTKKFFFFLILLLTSTVGVLLIFSLFDFQYITMITIKSTLLALSAFILLTFFYPLEAKEIKEIFKNASNKLFYR